MPKFPSKVKGINIKVKVIIIWILKGHLLDLEGALLHSLPKSEGAMAFLAPAVPTSLHELLGNIKDSYAIPSANALYLCNDSTVLLL